MQTTKNIETGQFSQTDWKRLTDYVSLLVTIKQRLSRRITTIAEAGREY